MEALDKFLEQMEGAYRENSVIFRYNLNKVSVVYCRYVLYIYVSTVHQDVLVMSLHPIPPPPPPPEGQTIAALEYTLPHQRNKEDVNTCSPVCKDSGIESICHTTHEDFGCVCVNFLL